MEYIFNTNAFDPNSIMAQIELLVRLALACLCGGAIGLERTHRLKDAGIRTHLVVTLGACLMMIISKYGFYDVVASAQYDLRADVSRIASQIVTGVGFLGAGVIFVKRGAVKGLTTAAGVWTTAGIGMAIGAGMYVIGIVSTAVIIASQYILHRFFNRIEKVEIDVKLKNDAVSIENFKSMLEDRKLRIERFELNGRDGDVIKIFVVIKKPENVSLADAAIIFAQNPNIVSFTSHKQNKEEL